MRELHPLSIFVAVAVTVFSAALLSDPVITAVFFAGALLTASLASVKRVVAYIGVIPAVAAVNPIFSHNGETILFFVNSRPFTLEAFLYGVNMGFMLCAAVLFMSAYSKIMTADKHLYLFGKINPHLGLLVSSAMRFVPLLKRTYTNVSDASKTMGMYSDEVFSHKIRARINSFTGALSQCFENGVITAASMEARDYGSGKRTSYTLFVMRKKDYAIIFSVLICAAVLAANAAEITFGFYPCLTPISSAKLPRAAFCVMSLCLPAAEIKERLFWKYSALKISASHTARAKELFWKI